MKNNAFGTPEAKLPATKVASQPTIVSQPSDKPANEPVPRHEVQQEDASSSQRHVSPAQSSGNTNDPAVSKQASSSVLGFPPAPAGENLHSSVDSASSFSPTPSAGSHREVLETQASVGGEHIEVDQEDSPTNVAASTIQLTDKADEDSLRNGNSEDSTQHSIDHEENTEFRPAVGANSSTDPATVHRNDNVLEGDAAPNNSSTATGETKI
ncbi:trans-sialidase, putative, partial [Trypanosoma cruzi marinkellei]